MKSGRISPERTRFLRFFLLSVFLIVSYQITQLSLFHNSPLVERAMQQYRLVVDIPPLRGAIQDRNGQGLAINLRVPSLYAVPRILKAEEKEDLSRQIAELLSLSHSFVRERLNRDKSFVWIKRRITIEEAKKIEALGHHALGILYEYKRFYPHGQLLANLLGFTNVDGQGLEGIERMVDGELRGKPGKRYTRRDALGREIKAFEDRSIPALDGRRVVLTIDRYLQYVTERALERSYHEWKAKGAVAILMNPHTGEILAMANRPTFDPNSPGGYPFENYRNRALTDMFEPGSIFKIVTAAGVLSERKVKMNEMFDCENGEWTWGSKTLHDVHSYGLLPFPDVFVKSSNIGTVKVASRLGPEKLYHYVKLFGFAERTGIDLDGEASGFIRPPAQWSKTSPYAIPIGQEVMATPLQLARAISFVANGGHLVKPYVIDRIEDVHGITLSRHTAQRKGPQLEPQIVEVLKEILWRVTEEGTGKKARVNGVPVAGKTGTAQKILTGGKGYSHSNFIGSFIGFAPADHPFLAMVVMIDDPHPSYYGGTVAAPVFSEVMEAALAHLGYTP
ncbi:MAG: penicillin-binding protein 2 [Candidatus Omnitrophica bacterium]|nr:penicillin-binding protein 2 [Candidatus Omnitrophota bacterium]